MDDVLDELEALVQQALHEGARAAEVLCLTGDGHALSVRPGSAPTHKTTSRDELRVRVWVDGGRVGALRGRRARGSELVGQALAATFESAENRHAGPMAAIAGFVSGLGTEDRRYAHLGPDDRAEVLLDAERQVTSTDARFAPTGFAYTDERLWRGLVNSRGLRLQEASTRYRLEGSAEGAGLTLRQHIEARSFSSVASLPLGTQLARRGAALLNDGQGLPAGPVRVVLPPLPVSRILAALGAHFTPDTLESDRFFLSPGDVFGKKLHVVDDGARPGALRTRAFDDRGVPPVPLTLIKEGVIDARFLDPETARAFDTRPTGHCWYDELGPSNLLMRSGTRSLNALLTELKGPSLKVDDLDPAGIDLRTGALDCRVSGEVLEANKVVGALRHVRLRGNLRDLLGQIVDIGNDTDRIGHVDAAGMIADGLVLELD